jgi:hypothetical protein
MCPRKGICWGGEVNGHGGERPCAEPGWALLISNRRNTMSAKINFAAVIAIAVLVAPALASAQAVIDAYSGTDDQPQRYGNAMSGAYAAANRSRRATRPTQRGRVSQATDPSIRRMLAPDGRDLGTDPDAAIRIELRRDSGSRM